MGDVNLGAMLENYKRGVVGKIVNDGINPFSWFKRQLMDADLNVCNLECVLSDTSERTVPFNNVMRSPKDFVKVLRENNIQVVNLANNHTLDHGFPAYREMKSALHEAGIATIEDAFRFSDEKPLIIEKKGLSLGFIGYYIEETIQPAAYDEVVENMHKQLKQLETNCDQILLSLHWGHEYTSNPLSWQIQLAKELIKRYKKLSVIYGHHSHTLQGIHTSENCVFAPSLGNFVFDDCIKNNRISGLLNVSISDSKMDHKLMPCFINTNYQPEPTASFDAHIHRLNKALEADFTNDDLQNTDWDQKLMAESKRGHMVNRIKVRLLYFMNLFRYHKDLKTLMRRSSGR
jgi:poly-gamma-glutamate synthesis protein (capsule biosynthesis protein)